MSCSLKITRNLRAFAAGVAPNEAVEGMAAMSRKFRDLARRLR